MFDDNNITDYTVALKIFQELEHKYNCKLSATTYVWVHTVDLNSNYCNLDQLRELRRNDWEIASHSMNHPIMTLLSESEMRYELRESRDSLRKMGFNPASFAFPCGICNDHLRSIAFEYYNSVRDTRDRSWFVPLDQKYLGCLIIQQESSVESVKRRIELALIREEDYVIFLFHKLGDGPKEVTPEKFYQITEMLITEYNLFPTSLAISLDD